MVNDRSQQKSSEQSQTANMFGSNPIVGPPKKTYSGAIEDDFDMSPFFNPSGPGNVAEIIGQTSFSSTFYSQQKTGSSGLTNRGQSQFGRSISIPGGQITPTSSENNSQGNQSRGILSMSRNSISGNQLNSSQLGGTALSNRSMPSPTRGISPIDTIFNMNKQGNRPINPAISRNHSLNQVPLSAIGSESVSQFRQQQHPLSGGQQQGGLSSPVNSLSIPGLNPFNLDQSEFPALQQRRPIGSQPTSTSSSKTPYGSGSGLMSKQNENEFHIHNEDFPALPGASAISAHMKAVFPDQDGRGDESNLKFNPLGSLQIGGQGADDSNQKVNLNQQKGIQVLPDNSIKNIPNSMLIDQYGIVGLFAFIKAAESDPTLDHLALGTDLTTLGLNLNSPDNLYHKFQSPFSRQPCRLQDIDYFVPSEYLTNAHIRDKLAPIKLNRYGEDLLFYVFYSNPGDVLQLAAAAELYNRDWRYHKEERLWITRAPGIEPRMKASTYEQGTYYYFDCQNWRKVAKEFHLEYDKLEERPHLPNLISLHFNPAQHG